MTQEKKPRPLSPNETLALAYIRRQELTDPTHSSLGRRWPASATKRTRDSLIAFGLATVARGDRNRCDLTPRGRIDADALIFTDGEGAKSTLCEAYGELEAFAHAADENGDHPESERLYAIAAGLRQLAGMPPIRRAATAGAA